LCKMLSRFPFPFSMRPLIQGEYGDMTVNSIPLALQKSQTALQSKWGLPFVIRDSGVLNRLHIDVSAASVIFAVPLVFSLNPQRQQVNVFIIRAIVL